MLTDYMQLSNVINCEENKVTTLQLQDKEIKETRIKMPALICPFPTIYITYTPIDAYAQYY